MSTSWHSAMSAQFQKLRSIKFGIYSTAAFSVSACVMFFFFVFQRQEVLIAYADKSFNRDLQIVHTALRIKRAMVEHDSFVFRYLYTEDDQWLMDIDGLQKTVRDSVAALRDLVRTNYMSSRLDLLEKGAQAYFTISDEIPRTSLTRRDSAAASPNDKELERRFNLGQNRINETFNLCDEFISVGRVEAERSSATLVARLQHARQLAVGLGLLLGLGILGLAVRLAVIMIGPLNGLMEGVRRLKDGETEIRIPVAGNDEMGQLTNAFNDMVKTISEQKERLLQETITDGLTGVYNQRYFHEILGKECERARRTQEPLSLLMIDLDHFKEYNDIQGHEMGNELLRRFAAAVRDQLRATDTLARYGGDEFSILLVNATALQAQVIVMKIEETIAKGRFPGARSLPGGRVTMSIGGATMPDNAETSTDLVLKADEALYAAKAAGRGCIRWAGADSFDRRGNSVLAEAKAELAEAIAPNSDR
jgi:diguanylate cyclase (GGDEF)-like protein